MISYTKKSLLAVVIILTGILAKPAHAQLFYASSSEGTIDQISGTGIVSTWDSGQGMLFNLTVGTDGALYTENLNGTIAKYSSPSTSTAKSTFATAGVQCLAVATDAQGNVYQASLDAGNVMKYNSAGQMTSSFSATGIGQPRTMVLDGAGNIYLSNFASSTVTKYNAAGALLNTFAIADAASFMGLALDASGNMFVSSGGKVYEISASGDVSTFYSGGVQLYGVAFAGADLYVIAADRTILEINPDGSYKTFATGLDSSTQWLTVVIPEPTSWALFAGSVCLLGLFRRKQSRIFCR